MHCDSISAIHIFFTRLTESPFSLLKKLLKMVGGIDLTTKAICSINIVVFQHISKKLVNLIVDKIQGLGELIPLLCFNFLPFEKRKSQRVDINERKLVGRCGLCVRGPWKIPGCKRQRGY